MLNGPEMEIAWIDGRIRLLDLIEARLEKTNRWSKTDVIMERCRHWDAQLRKLVVAEIERVKGAKQ